MSKSAVTTAESGHLKIHSEELIKFKVKKFSPNYQTILMVDCSNHIVVKNAELRRTIRKVNINTIIGCLFHVQVSCGKKCQMKVSSKDDNLILANQWL